jgi:hypothetical protein
VAIALGAEGGGVWLYLERDKRLVCELNRIPEVVAVGDLNPDNVNRVVQRAITDGVPILVSRAEAPGEAAAGQDISVVCVGFPMDEGVAGALLLYRDASDRQYFSRESVYLCQSLTPFFSLYAARSASRQVVQQTMRLGALVELAAELANTQDPERVAYLATNRVPTIVSCERIPMLRTVTPCGLSRSEPFPVRMVSGTIAAPEAVCGDLETDPFPPVSDDGCDPDWL